MPTVARYNGALTREQFLLRELRIVARLMCDDHLDAAEAVERVCSENLFQYPTEREQASIARACCRRLGRLSTVEDVQSRLMGLIAHGSAPQAAQTAVYAFMCDNRLVWEFMTGMVGERYRRRDLFLPRRDIIAFLDGLAQMDGTVASWSDATRNKVRQVLNRMLVDAGFKESVRSDSLLPVYVDPELAACIRANGDTAALAAFDCLGDA